MTDRADNESTPRTKPTERAWLDAKRAVAARNDAARKAGKQQRAAHERQIEELRRTARGVYR